MNKDDLLLEKAYQQVSERQQLNEEWYGNMELIKSLLTYDVIKFLGYTGLTLLVYLFGFGYEHIGDYINKVRDKHDVQKTIDLIKQLRQDPEATKLIDTLVHTRKAKYPQSDEYKAAVQQLANKVNSMVKGTSTRDMDIASRVRGAISPHFDPKGKRVDSAGHSWK